MNEIIHTTAFRSCKCDVVLSTVSAFKTSVPCTPGIRCWCAIRFFNQHAMVPLLWQRLFGCNISSLDYEPVLPGLAARIEKSTWFISDFGPSRAINDIPHAT